jgi:SAM-dependent methyltransferase
MAAVPVPLFAVMNGLADAPPEADLSSEFPAMSPERIDSAAIAAITDLYREILPAGGAILDVMSSWVSHLPPETHYHRVVGISADACALSENPFLDDWRVQDLNANPKLPFADGEFDGATLCVAIQHMTRPGELIREIARVLRPGAPLVVTFSQRCEAARAVACWCLLDDAAQLCLVAQHFADNGNWADIRCLDRTPAGGGSPLYAVIGTTLTSRPQSDGD